MALFVLFAPDVSHGIPGVEPGEHKLIGEYKLLPWAGDGVLVKEAVCAGGCRGIDELQ
jgi:hypothetical protein